MTCAVRIMRRPVQSIDANINEDGGSVRYYAEVPIKDETTEEWLKGNAAYLASTKLAGGAQSVGVDIRIARQSCMLIGSHLSPSPESIVGSTATATAVSE